MPIPGNLLSPTTEMVDPNTSGWRARENCSTSLGSGGRNGPGCLQITSTASGEFQVETVSAYPVTAGTEYYVFADAASSTQPEQIGIEWLDDTYTPVGDMTWSLTTSSASASWHRISVAGPAPSGAVQARVVLSAVAGAAGRIEYLENVYLGLPKRTPGNMFSFAVESGKEDADVSSGWVNDTNASITRQAPPMSWSVNFYLAGGHVMAVTASAAGNASTRQTTHPTVTPGTEYVGYMYLNPPTASSNCWVELRWLNAAGTQISATRAPLVAPSNGWYRQHVSDIAPAGAASVEMAAGITGATSGQVLRLEGVVLQQVVPVKDGSVIPYAPASFEQGVAGWSTTSGPAVLARSAPWGAHAYLDQYSLQVSSGAATSIVTSPKFPLGDVAEGDTWAPACEVSVGAGAWNLGLALSWYDASGALIRADDSETVAIPSTDWWILTSDLPAPAGAVFAAVQITAVATAASSVLYVDQVTLVPSVPLSEIAVVPETASVIVTARGLAAGQTATLWRVAANGSRTLVRSYDGLIDGMVLVSDLLVVEDYEAPLGVPVSYYAEFRWSDGSLARESSWSTVTVPPPADRNMVWLKDPGNPQFNMLVMVQTAPDWTRPIEQAAAAIRGRRNKQTRSGRRNGREGSLTIFTRSDDEIDALGWLLDSGNALLWQAAPGMGVKDMYVSVGEVTEARITTYAPEPWRLWTLPLVESDMPILGVSGSANRTWQDVLSTFATWADVAAAYATWDDVRIDRRIGG